MKLASNRFKLGAHQFLWKSPWTDDDLSILALPSDWGAPFSRSPWATTSGLAAPLARHAESLGLELTVGREISGQKNVTSPRMMRANAASCGVA